MISVDLLKQAMLQLHLWRQGFNGEQLGYGFDQYRPDEQFHYAEGYAQWGKGYLSLFQLTGSGEFLQSAEASADWLLAHPNPGYEGYSWGLPWSWAAYDTPPTLSYLITTVLVGDLLLALYEATRTQRYLAAAESVASWMEKENGGVQTAQGLGLYYANFQPLRILVVNPTAKASGFFTKLHNRTKEQRFEHLGRETARWVLGQQNDDGSWYYSRTSGKVDNVHTGFTLEGMWDAYLTFQHEEWRQSLERGTGFYWQHLFDSRGKGRERKLYAWQEFGRVPLRAWLKDRLMALGLLSDRIPETRAWGYGAAMRTFALASYVEDAWLDKAKLIWEYVVHNLLLDDGSYAYRQDTPQSYIRCEAHLFDAFGRLARRLYDRERSSLGSAGYGHETSTMRENCSVRGNET